MAGLFLLLLSALTELTAVEPATIAWLTEGDFCEPETVLPLPDDTLLVSNVCGFGEPGNGYLSLLAPDGRVIDWRAVDGLDSPLGMTSLDGRVYVVDANRVRVFRWPGFEAVMTIELDTAVANDIAVADDGTMYVTDTARGEVVVRSPAGELSRLSTSVRFAGANGVHIDGSRLYVGGSRLWCVNLNDLSVTTIGPEWLADIDGIELEANGTLQLTPVGGPLVRYRAEDDIQVLGGEGISSANHGYAATLQLALIPTGFDNTVIAIAIEP